MAGWDTLQSLDAAGADWSALAAMSGNIFATPEWARTWWTHFGGAKPPIVLRCQRGDDTLALAPLYLQRRGPVRLLRFLGHGPADILGPICRPEDDGEASAAVVSALGEGAAGRWDMLLAERVPGGALAEALDGRLLRVEANPSLDIEGRDWEDYLATTSRNLREKLRRNTRKIEKSHGLRYLLCEDPTQLDEMLETLFRLHGMRWRGSSSFEDSRILDFHREFARLAMDRGWLRLWTMEIDEAPVAAWYGFRFGDIEAYYQSGRDPHFDRFSVGFLMLMRTIRAAFEDRVARYAFLRGDEAYKGRFATTEARLETRAIGRGPLAHAGIELGALAMRSPLVRRRAVAALR